MDENPYKAPQTGPEFEQSWVSALSQFAPFMAFVGLVLYAFGGWWLGSERVKFAGFLLLLIAAIPDIVSWWKKRSGINPDNMATVEQKRPWSVGVAIIGVVAAFTSWSVWNKELTIGEAILVVMAALFGCAIALVFRRLRRLE